MSDDVAASTEAREPRLSVEELLGEHLLEYFQTFVAWVVSKGSIRWHEAEDIVSDAYTKVYRHLLSDPQAADRWEKSPPEKRTGYVRRAVANMATDHLRKNKEVLHPLPLEERPDEPDPGADPAEAVVLTVEFTQAMKNLQSLSQRDRDVLITATESVPRSEQAALLAMTPGAFRTALTRARAKYTAKFPQHEPEDN